MRADCALDGLERYIDTALFLGSVDLLFGVALLFGRSFGTAGFLD